MFGKTALLKIFKHSQKTFFSRDTFKPFELFNLSSFYVIHPAQSCPPWKLTPPRMFSVSVTREQKFLKVMEERLWWEHVLEKKQSSCILQSSLVNTIICIVMYEKVVLLEISRNSLLTRVRGLQSTGCNTNSQQNFLKLL